MALDGLAVRAMLPIEVVASNFELVQGVGLEVADLHSIARAAHILHHLAVGNWAVADLRGQPATTT